MVAVTTRVSSAETARLKALGKSLRAEADGKALRKDLTIELRAAVQPAVEKVKETLSAWPHNSGTPSSPAMGSYLASRTKASVRLTSPAGVAVRIPQTPKLRGFKLAARRLNRESWRHPVFGSDVWVTQVSANPGFFDKIMSSARDDCRAAILAAMEAMEARVGK